MTSRNELHREREQRSKVLLVATICDSSLHKSLEKTCGKVKYCHNLYRFFSIYMLVVRGI